MKTNKKNRFLQSFKRYFSKLDSEFVTSNLLTKDNIGNALKVITQEEYDSLSDNDKQNNFYFIKQE